MNEPKLRFKADDGNQFPSWDEKKLGDICTPLTYGMNVAAIKYDGLNKYIRITDIDDESHLYKSDEYVSPNGVLDDRYLVGENDILFARTGASVGKSYIYNKKDGKLYYAGFLIKAHVKSENSNFVFYQTLTERYAKWVQLTSMRSGQPGINANEYSEFGIQIPCLQEQQKIASLFTELDNLIQSAKKELDGYRELKQGMLQKMFPKKGEKVPEIRFPEFTGDWELCVLGEITKTNPFKPFIVEGASNGSYEVIQQGDTPISGYANGQPFQNYENITLFGDHTLSLYKPKSPFFVASDGVKILSPSIDMNGLFYYYLLMKYKPNSEGYKRHYTIMKSCEASYPSNRDEQMRIAEYFENLDNLIVSQQQELDGYKELKKGLLQQMFC